MAKVEAIITCKAKEERVKQKTQNKTKENNPIRLAQGIKKSHQCDFRPPLKKKQAELLDNLKKQWTHISHSMHS